VVIVLRAHCEAAALLILDLHSSLIPGWGGAAQQPSGYPQYPRTPYTMYPSLLPTSISHTPGAQPCPYLSPTVTAYIATNPPPDPHPCDPGLTADWLGFQHFSPNPMGAPPAYPPMTPWGPRQPYPPFGQLMNAGPYGSIPLPQRDPPAAPPHITPAASPMDLDPYSGMTWAMEHQAQLPEVPTHQPQQHPPMHVPQHMMGPTLARVGDRVDPFMAGRNCKWSSMEVWLRPGGILNGKTFTRWTGS